MPDFIRCEPGTSYRFCRTEMKKDGGNMKEDSPKLVFAALKKKKNDDCLESLSTKILGELWA